MNVHAEIETLREEVRQLRSRLQARAIFAPAWRLSRSEQRILGCFLRRRLVTRDDIMYSLYFDRNEEANDPIVTVHLSRIRKKLTHLGVEIRSEYGIGWRISDEDYEKLQSIVLYEDVS